MPQSRLRSPLLVTALVALAVACGDRAGNGGASNDPNAPAVVKAPAVVFHSDTAPPDTTDSTEARVGRYRSEILTNFSVLSTAIMVGDARTASSIFEGDAVVEMPDSTFRSSMDAVRGLAALMLRAKATEMRRNSMFTEILPDSMISDSGLYVLAHRRDTVVTEVTRGWYKSLWRVKAGGTLLIVRDRFNAVRGYPLLKKSPPARKSGVSGP